MCLWVCNGKYRGSRKRKSSKDGYRKGYRADAKTNAYAKSKSDAYPYAVTKSVADPYTDAESVTGSPITNTSAHSTIT